jgi:hypothetical protein
VSGDRARDAIATVRPGRLLGQASGTLAIVALGLAIPAVLSIAGGWSESVPLTAVVAAIVFISSLRLATLMARRDIRLMEAGFWTFVYVSAGLVPIIQRARRQYPWPGDYSESVAVTAMLMVLLACLSFHIGIITSGAQRLRVNRGTRVPRHSVGYLIGAVGLGGALSILIWLGDWTLLFSSRAELLGVVIDRVGMMGYALMMPVVRSAPLIAGLILFANRSGSGKRLSESGRRLFVFVTLLAAAVLSNPLTTPRYWTGTVLASIVIVWAARTLPMRPRLWIIGMIAGYAFVYPHMAGLGHASRAGSTVGRAASEVATDVYLSGDFDVFQQTMNAVEIVDREGPDLGVQLTGSVGFWVPRRIWSGKPVSTGSEVAAQLGYAFTNLSFPLWAEAFFAFSWTGVFVVFLVYGLLVRKADRTLSRSLSRGRTDSIIVVLVAILAPYQFFLLRGSLLHAVAFISPSILLLVVTATLSRYVRFPSSDRLSGGTDRLPAASRISRRSKPRAGHRSYREGRSY